MATNIPFFQERPPLNAAKRLCGDLNCAPASPKSAHRRVAVLCNERQSETLTCAFEVVAAANVAAADGLKWYRIVPYGDWPYRENGTQHVDKDVAKGLRVAFEGIVYKILRFFGSGTALPVYRGHPDDAYFEQQAEHIDKTVYGKVTAMEERDDGLYAAIDWSADFAKLPKGLFFSVRWLCTISEDGKIWTPFKIISVGLTDKPNIPGTSAANSKAAQPQTQKSNMNWKKLLQALGFSNEKAEAYEKKTGDAPTEADILANAEALKVKADNAATAANEATSNKTALDKVNAELTAANAKIKTLETAVANERKAAVDAVLSQAVASNCLTEAQANDRRPDLEKTTDFPTLAKTILANASTGLNTKQKTAGAGGREDNAEGKGAQNKFRELVAANEKQGKPYAEAWAQTEKDNPELYKQAFTSPETK